MSQMSEAVSGLEDVVLGHVDAAAVIAGVQDGSVVLLRGRARQVAVGGRVPVKVNTNIGISDTTPYALEVDKLARVSAVRYRPDLMMDHTIEPSRRDFWRDMVASFGGPVGTLPQYTAYSPRTGIDKTALLERIAEMLEGGVAFMTLHITSDMDIYRLAQRLRAIPVTSRGGGLVLRDLELSGKSQNVFRESLDDIAALFRKYDAAISVGSTFRPPDVGSALDDAHVVETERQVEVVQYLQQRGVKVLLEGLGHAPMNKLQDYIGLIQSAHCPFMPLGPMTTDSAIGFDHVTSAIGGALMAFFGGAHVLNSVTREEHTGGVPSLDAVVEGLKAARVAAHSVNVSRFASAAKLDALTVERRGAQASCVVAGGLFDAEIADLRRGCNRCSFECPIILAPGAPEERVKP